MENIKRVRSEELISVELHWDVLRVSLHGRYAGFAPKECGREDADCVLEREGFGLSVELLPSFIRDKRGFHAAGPNLSKCFVSS